MMPDPARRRRPLITMGVTGTLRMSVVDHTGGHTAVPQPSVDQASVGSPRPERYTRPFATMGFR